VPGGGRPQCEPRSEDAGVGRRDSHGRRASSDNLAIQQRGTTAAAHDGPIMEQNLTQSASKIRPLILVVDDDSGLRESLSVLLEDEYEVLQVPDGAQALDVVRSCQVDLVLLDIRMPGMDGITVLERMKALDEQIEVILVTAVKEVRSAVAAMKLGAFDYLTKPFEEEEVLSSISRALEKRALEREVVFLRSELARKQGFGEIVGQHFEMQ